MGNLIKNHLARLVVLTAGAYQVAASLEGFFWPKIFWDFLTKNFDGAVKPIPILQILNLIFGILTLLWEWPIKYSGFPDSGLRKSMEARIFLYPLVAVAAVMMYQATNPALYYMIGVGIYFWAYTDGEIICEKNWTLPKRASGRIAYKV